MNNSQFLLILNGPMCAGKSTVADMYMQRDHMFRGAFDAAKWLISKYSVDSGVTHHREIAMKVVFHMVSAAIESGLSVVVDGGFLGYRNQYRELAEKHNIAFLILNIEAPLHILEERYKKRIEHAVSTGNEKILTSMQGFYERYQWYLDNNKDPDGVTFDSSVMTPDEIVSEADILLT